MTLSKPPWIKIRYSETESVKRIRSELKKKGHSTVCQESLCPNISECWGSGTATFLLMGNTCTRGCRFCSVKTARNPAPLDRNEPKKLLQSIKQMKLSYAVLTSVDRDDLPDQGSTHLAQCITHLKTQFPTLKVEILMPDFQGKEDLIHHIINAYPDIIAHNIETVRRLTPHVRDPRASYNQSLQVLQTVNRINPVIPTKSSIMVGLGETDEEIEQTMDDLKAAGVSILTIGQYLQPTPRQLPVHDYILLDKFKYYEQIGTKKGFSSIIAGPFVRSSYRAGELFHGKTG